MYKNVACPIVQCKEYFKRGSNEISAKTGNVGPLQYTLVQYLHHLIWSVVCKPTLFLKLHKHLTLHMQLRWLKTRCICLLMIPRFVPTEADIAAVQDVAAVFFDAFGLLPRRVPPLFRDWRKRKDERVVPFPFPFSGPPPQGWAAGLFQEGEDEEQEGEEHEGQGDLEVEHTFEDEEVLLPCYLLCVCDYMRKQHVCMMKLQTK